MNTNALHAAALATFTAVLLVGVPAFADPDAGVNADAEIDVQSEAEASSIKNDITQALESGELTLASLSDLPPSGRVDPSEPITVDMSALSGATTGIAFLDHLIARVIEAGGVFGAALAALLD